MVAPNYPDLCTEAERYYYDMLIEETAKAIPIEIFSHIIICNHCRERISQLETTLSKGKELASQDLKHHENVVTAMLKLHFAHEGKQVTCSTIRPFLPNQLIPALLMRIPTPITAHLDNCEQCREDLKRLHNLGLNHKQLTTLSQMFADDLTKDDSTCAEARKAIPNVIAMAFERVDAKILRHLSLCPECREELYNSREAVIQQMKASQNKNNTGKKVFDCQSVTSSDIFDYCIPYAIDPLKDEYAKFRKSLTSHIIQCADCLDKTQQLHRTIYEIIDRPQSGIATVFHLDTSSKAMPQTESDNLYADFPVKIEVSDLGEVPISKKQPDADKCNKPVKLKSFSNKIKPFMKVALPIAAVLIVAFGLLYSLPSAKALNIAQIQEAILRARNVRISSFVSGQTEPIQEEWVSRKSDIYITKTGETFSVWDINAGIHKTHNKQNTTEQTALSSEEAAKVEKMMNGTIGLIPFKNISALPKDAQWIRAIDKEQCEVYDLFWNENNLSNKWRVFVDPKTKLPVKTEFYQMAADDKDYTLQASKIIEYPSDAETHEMLDKTSF